MVVARRHHGDDLDVPSLEASRADDRTRALHHVTLFLVGERETTTDDLLALRTSDRNVTHRPNGRAQSGAIERDGV